MSTNLTGGSSGFDSGQADPPAEAAPGGACSGCGRALPPPDLEAAANEIDHVLSLEAGRLVPRAAWAGRPPDGLVDTLFAWLPMAKARRRLWERGQQLWTERMTAALSGPCADCIEASPPAAMLPHDATVVQHPAPSAAPPGVDPTDDLTTDRPTEAFMPPPARPDILDRPTDLGSPVPPALAAEPDQATRAFAPGEESATTAMEVPSSLADASAAARLAAPEPPAAKSSAAPPDAHLDDEHEAHTVMITALPSLTGGSRLVVMEGPVHGRQFSLGRQTTTIGRSIGCHVTVEADAVAYDHARVVRDASGWRLEPVAGASDTYVNDEPVAAARALANGDVIRVGPARFKFEQAG